MSDIILDTCMRGILQLLYIIPFFQNFKNSPKIQKLSDHQKKSITQVSDIILDACINFESYLTKTVGGDRV